MKKNRLLVFTIAIAFIIGLGSTVYFMVNNMCSLDGESVCYNKDKEQFQIEDGAKLIVQVENKELGQYLQETWDKEHPEHKGAIKTNVQKPLSVKELSQGFPYDIMVTSQNNAAYFINDMQNLGNTLGSVVGSKIPIQLQDAINIKGYYFVQNSIDGWFFVYNETLLEEMGFDLTISEGVGLPDALESWELIFENSDKILEKSKYVFPLTFSDQNSFYPFLTGGRWGLNFTNRGSVPGFDSREFREGLHLISEFTNHDYYKLDEKKEKEKPQKPDEASENEEVEEEIIEPKKLLPWLYEEAFYKRETPFTMLHSSMKYEQRFEKSEDVYKVSPFPTYKNHHLSPMGEVNGYMVRGDVEFPSASAEVLRILRSPEALKQYKSADGKTLIYNRSNFDDLDFEETDLRKILSYNYSDTPSVLALDNNPNKLARSLYDEVDIMDILEKLYLNELTVEETQKEINERAQAWLEEFDINDDE
ncbi:ABC transporter substrate-binding protein [Erysipelothrix urinaevulpis]|uniref:ABC transporter substrate-binding protein n=1 Tax=Erysipelothrix urinaevulpis TaxID=2683717 RepID=UPI0013572F76|nr:ABC transporter substrate-binding protein [Erysipelothrix urinaevulpis]